MDVYYDKENENIEKMDAEVIKTHYPRDNNSKVLSFVLQEKNEMRRV